MAKLAYKNLKAAVELLSDNGHGLCIHRAAAFVLDVPGSEMCFGTLRAANTAEKVWLDGASDVPFIHAWAEYHGEVYAPTTIERMGNRLVPISRTLYYETNGVMDVKRLSRKEILKLSGDIGLIAHLRYSRPTRGNVSVGATFLDAAGVDWINGEDGGILPRQGVLKHAC